MLGTAASFRFPREALRTTAWAVVLILAGIGLAPIAGADEARAKPDPEQARFFEAEVRPLLVTHCFKCHGSEKQKGGLRLDGRSSLLTGGDSGPAVDPDDLSASLLMEAVNYEGLEMPPAGKLPDDAIATFSRWVSMGAPWPENRAAAAAPAAAAGKISEEDRAWWAFQPVQDPAIPDGPTTPGRDQNPIDRFIDARLAATGLSPAPEASKHTLIRRLSLDLTGLPPTPEEIDAFLSDGAPNAYERLVERLLASPRYGERSARQWLDLVRYADSDGYRIDHPRPNAWRYRDYVIRSFNMDKPYDLFVREQIAGDELDPENPEALIATGYLRHGIYEYNNRDVRSQWTVILDDVTDTTADVFLGLGLQCARCHDHKYDPILQKDYYRLQAFFAPILPQEEVSVATTEALAQYEKAQAAWELKTATTRRQIQDLEARYRKKAREDAVGRFPEDIQPMLRKPAEEREPLERQLVALASRQIDFEYDRIDTQIKGEDKEKLLALKKELARFDGEKPEPPAVALGVRDVGPVAPPVVIPKKGPEPVEPGFPTVLDPEPARVEPVSAAPASTGRRAALAIWLTREDNPLTARVMVNRIWQQHFGRGLAQNPSDFGRLGEQPTHPELLDWLTARFLQDGWRLKDLHRRIVTSATYRESSHHPDEQACRVKDPENRLYARATTRRLDAEEVRDSLLAATGELSTTAGGPGVEGKDPRRSIYMKVMRNAPDPLLEVFDLPLFFQSTASRQTTTTPLQSLLLLNSPLMIERARAFAARVELEANHDDRGAIVLAYRHALGRAPTAGEVDSALAFIQEQSDRIDPEAAKSASAWLAREKLPFRDGQAALISPGSQPNRFEVPHAESLSPGDFTIEAFFLARSVDDGAAVRTIAAKWDGDLKRPGWSFGVTGRGSRRKPQTLSLQLIGEKRDGTFGEVALFSDQNIQIGRPYYASVAVKLAGDGPGTATFYLKDLGNDDEPLLKAEVTHEFRGGDANRLPMTLGGRAGARAMSFDGLIDDLRLSDSALGEGQLLFTSDGDSRRALAYWRFEADPGVFHDSTGHGHDIRKPGTPRPTIDPDRQALADFCQALLNSSEFLYVD